MKKRGIKIINSIFLSVLLVGILLQYGCKSNNSGMSPKPVITGVRDIHPDSAAVNKIGPGQTVVIEGNNLITTKEVTFDGYQTSINQTLFTDTTVIASIPSNLPFSKVKSDSLNQIHLVSKFGETTYKFPILPPKPVVNSVSNEFAYPGQKININGNYLYLVKSIVFPGSIKATQYSGTADGSQLTVTVPQGVAQSDMGSIKIVTQAGTALSAPMVAFHDTTGMVCNFDNKDTFAYWSGTQDNNASTFPNGWGNYGHMKADSVSAGDGS
ncbi:MAG TPA: hypothetical protein VKA34_05815, partial [Balneolales bacterium]|nr:hypothetical protein [Balneolales bacterium]